MNSQRITRVNELLKREIADVLYREMAGTNFDFAAVTITRVSISPNLRRAHVSVSVRGDEEHAERALRALRRHRAHIQRFICKDIVLKYTPVLEFERDESLEKGDQVLHILSEMNLPEVEPAPPAPEEEPPDAPQTPPEN